MPDLEKTVKRMLDRRAELLFGKRFGQCSQVQQDTCLLFLNVEFGLKGIGASIQRAETPVQRETENAKVTVQRETENT